MTCRARPAPAPGREKKSACFAEISSRGLAGAGVLLDFVVDFLALNKGRETSAFDSGNVDENVLTATVGLDESKTFNAVEPLHNPSRHMRIPCTVCSMFDPTVRPDRFVSRLEIDAAKARNHKR